VAADDIVDRLYDLPLGEFVRARDEAARELRKAGEREEADRVKALKKPTAAAGAANRLVRERRDEVEEFLRAAVEVREAQLAGKGDLGAAVKRQRQLLEQLVRAGGEAVRQTLFAAAVDDEAAAELLAGRLERELEPRGFGTLLAHAPAEPPRRAARAASPAKPDDRAARAKLREATEALAAAEAEERQARRRLEQLEREVQRARAAVGKAEAELDRLHRR